MVMLLYWDRTFVELIARTNAPVINIIGAFVFQGVVMAMTSVSTGPCMPMNRPLADVCHPMILVTPFGKMGRLP